MALRGAEAGIARANIVGEIQMLITRLERRGNSIGFVWVPAHGGIEGNEVADWVAKCSLGRKEVDICL